MSLNPVLAGLRPPAHRLPSLCRALSTTPAVLNNNNNNNNSSSARASSTPAPSNAVPPQSPSYIRLPSPPQSQSDETKPPRVRGALPVPREVFPRADADRKTKPEYLERTAPVSPRSKEPSNASQRWKKEMADSRRANLSAGLSALYARREHRDRARDARVGANFRRNNDAAAAPEREDDRLTRSTVLDAMLDTKVYPDPHAPARLARSKARVAAKELARQEARRDALMELYINAAGFIVNEGELKVEIDRIFTDDYFRTVAQDQDRAGMTANVWGVYGKPPSVQDMLATTTGTSTRVMDFHESEYDRSSKRQKRIAEELTGGKMQ